MIDHSKSVRTLVAVAALLATSTAALAASGEELLAGADQRIEKHRKADAVISVVDASGKPVPGAKVQTEQTNHAFLFGCNIYRWGRIDDEKLEAAYRDRFAELLNYATVAFYWPSYERQRGKPDHPYAKRVAQWCKEHNIATKGHPLAWNYSDPAWLPDDPDEIYRLQLARIDDCVKRFAGLIDRWDVVNEATHFDRKDFIERRAPKFSAMWKKYGRIEFTRACFVEARKANPKATLLINDYRTDPAYEGIIKGLVDADGRRLYDVIGIQSHMHGGAWSNEKIWEVCERFAKFGVPLHFTETTILSGHRGWRGPADGEWASTPDGEKYQAREVVRFYTMLFSHPTVEAITWWDFSDQGSWKRAPAGFIRKDMTPKPAYDELKKLIKGKWWTKKTIETDKDGKATFRGFLGDYRVTVTAGDKTETKDFVLARDKDNRWEIASR